MCVCFIGVLPQRGFGGGYLKEKESHHHVRVLCGVYELIRGAQVPGMTLMKS